MSICEKVGGWLLSAVAALAVGTRWNPHQYSSGMQSGGRSLGMHDGRSTEQKAVVAALLRASARVPFDVERTEACSAFAAPQMRHDMPRIGLAQASQAPHEPSILGVHDL
jgi:hypothetical protein